MYIASVRRLGLSCFRIAMILSTIRMMETGDFSETIFCDERDYQTAISISQILVEHAASIFEDLPNIETHKKHPNLKERFYKSLPSKFNRQNYLAIASELNIPDKTVQNYIKEFISKNLLQRDKHDCYLKSNEENEDLKESKDFES